MLDIEFIRENTDKVKKATAAKQLDPSLVDKLLELDEKRRKLLGEIEGIRAKRNKLAAEKNIEDGKKIKEELKALEPGLQKVEDEYRRACLEIPNPPAED